MLQLEALQVQAQAFFLLRRLYTKMNHLDMETETELVESVMVKPLTMKRGASFPLSSYAWFPVTISSFKPSEAGGKLQRLACVLDREFLVRAGDGDGDGNGDGDGDGDGDGGAASAAPPLLPQS